MNKSFYALLVSQTSTNLGFALYTMAVVLHLFNETGSTALSAAVTLVSVISRMVSHVVLPSISDRYKLRDILKLSQLLQVVLLIGMFFLLLQKLTGVMTTAVFILLSLISFFNGFFVPIKSSLVKVVIPAKLRVKANSLISTVDQTFLFAGWTFGGVILAFLGIPLTLIITIFFLAISVFSLLLFKTNSSPDIKETAGMMERLTIGWKYLFKHKGLRILIMMDLMEAWVGTIWIGAVTLTYAEQALGKGEAWWGYINGGYYFGTIAGGILIYRLSKVMQGRLAGYMLVGSFIFGILTFLYGFISNPFVALLLVILMGPSYQLRDLAQETMFQNSTDENTLAKILAARSALVQFIFIFSILGIGALTDLIGVRLVYILSGGLLLFSSVYGFVHLILGKKRDSLETEDAAAK